MTITIGMLMDEAHEKDDKKAMEIIGNAYYEWFASNGKTLTPQTSKEWRNTPVLEVIKQEVAI